MGGADARMRPTGRIGRHLVEDASGQDGWGEKVAETTQFVVLRKAMMSFVV